MDRAFFSRHLHGILDWWEFLVDWTDGGVWVDPHPFSREIRWRRKDLLIHVRQLYNYSVGIEHGHPLARAVAGHLLATLDTVFPRRVGELILTPHFHETSVDIIDGYKHTYLILGLARHARAARSLDVAERALRIYRQLDETLSDHPLEDRGAWTACLPDGTGRAKKSDNASLHRAEAALNIQMAFDACGAERGEATEYLRGQVTALARFFDRRLARPEEGYQHSVLTDDCEPPPFAEHATKSLAHAFEWMGVCFEIESVFGVDLGFLDGRGRELTRRALAHGLAPNGCFRNDYVPSHGAAAMQGAFWPQVEALLGALWCRKRWGESDFPAEAAERMLGFYRRHFLRPAPLGGGILSSVSENGVPMDQRTGHEYKCDHHALRLCEKVIDYDLVPEGWPDE